MVNRFISILLQLGFQFQRSEFSSSYVDYYVLYHNGDTYEIDLNYTSEFTHSFSWCASLNEKQLFNHTFVNSAQFDKQVDVIKEIVLDITRDKKLNDILK